MSEEDINSFLGQSKFGDCSKYGHYTHLQAFYRWVIHEDIAIYNPMIKVAKIKAPQKYIPKNVMSRAEVEKMLTTASQNVNNDWKFRDKVICFCLFDATLRRCEVVSLDVEDYCSSTKSLRLRAEVGKTHQGRLTPISDRLCQMIEEQIERRPNPENRALFQNYQGTRISGSLIGTAVTRLRKKTKIRTKASPSSFRKTSATLMLKNNAPLITISKIMGHHKNLDQTATYSKVYPIQLEKMIRSKHTREREKNIKYPEQLIPKKKLSRTSPYVNGKRVEMKKMKAAIVRDLQEALKKHPREEESLPSLAMPVYQRSRWKNRKAFQ